MTSMRPYVGAVNAAHYWPYGYYHRQRPVARPQMETHPQPPSPEPSDKLAKKYDVGYAKRKVVKKTIKMPKKRNRYVPTKVDRVEEKKVILCNDPSFLEKKSTVYEPTLAKREIESKILKFSGVVKATMAFRKGAKRAKAYKPTFEKRKTEAKVLKCPHPRPRTTTPALLPYYRTSPLIRDPLLEFRQPVVPIYTSTEPPAKKDSPKPRQASPLADPILEDYGPRPPFIYYHYRSPTPEPRPELTEPEYKNTFQDAKCVKLQEPAVVHSSPLISPDGKTRQEKKAEQLEPEGFDKAPVNYFRSNPKRHVERSTQRKTVPHFTAVGSVLRGFENHGY